MDLDLYERDCEQAYYRFLEDKKQAIRDGCGTAATEIWIEDPPLTYFMQYRYSSYDRYEAQRANLILQTWKARASSELSNYWEHYSLANF